MKRAAAILLSVSAAILAPAQSQQYAISTYAGMPQRPVASSGYFGHGIAADAAGSVYFSDNEYCSCVFKLDQSGVITRIAGNFRAGFSGDGGPAASALLNRPNGLAVDGTGNLFIADSINNRIRKISPDGTINTVAGTGDTGYAQDGQLATSAPLNGPLSVAADASGNLFIADTFRDVPGGGSHPRVLKVSTDGIITTAAGNGRTGTVDSAEGGPATDAQIGVVSALAVDSVGDLFIAYSNVVRKVSPAGLITTVAGPGPPGTGLNRNSDCVAGVSGDGGPATQAPLCYPANLTVDPAGNLFIIEWMGIDLGVSDTVAVRKVSPDGIITTVVGADVGLYWGGQAVVDGGGNLLVADGSRLVKVSPRGIVTTIAGYGACCYSGDGGPATSAQLDFPHGLGIDGTGNLYIADTLNHRIRRVSRDGIIATAAGNGRFSVRCSELSARSGPAKRAELCNPFNIAVDGAGNVFVADGTRIRKVTPDGRITSVAGGGTFAGSLADGGLATEAQLQYVGAVAADGAGNLYFQDLFRIRKVSGSGIITTVAGNGSYGESGDGGLAIDTPITASYSGVAVDGTGNLFFLDSARVRKVSPGGIITTVAGNGKGGFSGDGGPATSAQISPLGLAVDAVGNLFIAEGSRVRRVSTNGIITTIVGPGANGSSEAVSADSVAVDSTGNVYVAGNNVVLILRPIQ